MEILLAILSEAAVGTAALVAPLAIVEPPSGEQQPATSAAFMLLEHRQTGVVEMSFPRQTRASPGRARWSDRLHPVGSGIRGRMLPVVRAAEARHRLPAGLLDALIAAESSYVPWAISISGAGGLAQLMPATAAELGVLDRFDPFQSIDGGARYLRRMLDRFGSISLALAAYNAGPGSVLKAGGIPFNGETPRYVARVLRIWTARPLG